MTADSVTNWSDRFDELATELDRLERQASADEIHVSTREATTHVTLVYDHDDGDE